MRRFLVGMVPPAVMGLAFWAYSDTSGWVWHTIEARRLANRLARDAGCEPDLGSLSRTLERFADQTGDNPVQVRAVVAIREAIARGDLKAIGPMADAAAEEETRLLKERTNRSMAAIYFAFGMGLLMSFLVDLTSLVGRTLRGFIARAGGGV